MLEKSDVRGWDDCLDLVLSILSEAKTLEEVRSGVECLQILVKGEKLELLKSELGVIGALF
ncbi:MAG: hypothetical protein NWF01_07955 [Candidatus Bathyarchaeota archaeon]|nr:hypothetical protein [Candidatus Bathyarchaeota archaeon]